jgi:hypothetical protein
MIRQGRETAEERCQKKSRLCFQAQAAFAFMDFSLLHPLEFLTDRK